MDRSKIIQIRTRLLEGMTGKEREFYDSAFNLALSNPTAAVDGLTELIQDAQIQDPIQTYMLGVIAGLALAKGVDELG